LYTRPKILTKEAFSIQAGGVKLKEPQSIDAVHLKITLVANYELLVACIELCWSLV